MTTTIFNISNNKESVNGSWVRKESLNTAGFHIADKVMVKQVYGEDEVELGEKTRDELISLVEMGGKFAYRDVDFGEMSGLAKMFGFNEPEWNYIYAAQLF